MYLEMMPDEFRDEYGDYFVAGYQYGGMYEAHITITTSTSEQLDKVKMQLGAKLRAMNASNDKIVTSADMQFSRETQEVPQRLGRVILTGYVCSCERHAYALPFHQVSCDEDSQNYTCAVHYGSYYQRVQP